MRPRNTADRRFDIIAGLDDAQPMGYLGGKAGAGVYQTIINRMLPHRVYVEPFLDSGAVMRHKKMSH